MLSLESDIRRKYESLRDTLDERSRRLWAASEAMAVGFRGILIVHRATGIARSTIGAGIRELREQGDGNAIEVGRTRRPGGGRKSKAAESPELVNDLEKLISPSTRGDPESPLRWTCMSLRNIAAELVAMGYSISYRTVGRLLKSLGYSLQGNRKRVEGEQHPDRNAQFNYINDRVEEALEAGQPAISVDTKKKELVGNYKNSGRSLRPKETPHDVLVHDFKGELGKANPYGVYDIERNEGWVSVGTTSDTSEFAVQTIRTWWKEMGKERYPNATSLLVTADCGGSNGYRTRLWKTELQKLATEMGIRITVCHFPPGTSKWNAIEHKLFSFISMNWRGQPLVDLMTIVSLIAATRTRAGLVVRCSVDNRPYEKGIRISDEELEKVKLSRHEFHGDWNYTILPAA